LEKSKNFLIAVTARAPYPLNSGGRIATYNTLLSLNKKYKIKLYIITDNSVDEQDIAHLKEIFYSVYVYKKSKRSSYLDAIRFSIQFKPLQLGYFYSNKFKKIIEKENNLESDYFIGFVLRTAIYGAKFKSKRFIYSIDSMYLNYKNSVKNTKNYFWKNVYLLESLLLKKYELSVVRDFDKISYVNPNEASYWSKHGNVACIPHGFDKVDNQKTLTSTEYQNSIIFIGRMDYKPNIIAVEWFILNVVNKLKKGVQLIIIGGYASSSLIKKHSNSRVKFLGFVEDPNIIIKNSLCSVAPMLTGGGLQTKIIKAFSLGSIVLMSKLAAKPVMNFIHSKHGFIAETPEEYVNLINDIHENKSKYISLKENAIMLFEKNYENSILENSLIKYFS